MYRKLKYTDNYLDFISHYPMHNGVSVLAVERTTVINCRLTTGVMAYPLALENYIASQQVDV